MKVKSLVVIPCPETIYPRKSQVVNQEGRIIHNDWNVKPGNYVDPKKISRVRDGGLR